MGCWMRSGFHRNDAMTAGRSHPRLLASGDVLSKPLDFSFRWAATGVLPSRRIQDFLSINDE